MSAHASSYRAYVAGGLRVAAGPLALVAANVAALAARGYRVRVRDADHGVVSVQCDHDVLHLSFHPGPGASSPPPWMNRFSELVSEISNTPTNQERSNTP